MADRYWVPKRPGINPGADPALSGGYWAGGDSGRTFNPFAPNPGAEHDRAEASRRLLSAQSVAEVRSLMDEYREHQFSSFSDESQAAAWAVVLQASGRIATHELHEMRPGRLTRGLVSHHHREAWEIVAGERWVTRDGGMYGMEEASGPYGGGRPAHVTGYARGEVLSDSADRANIVAPVGTRVRAAKRGYRFQTQDGTQVWWERGLEWTTILAAFS